MESVVIGEPGMRIVLATGQDLTAATKLEMHAVDPDGHVKTWTATAHSTPGSISYTTEEGDLDAEGIWKILAYIEWGEDSKHSSPDPYELRVVAKGTGIITTLEIRHAINIPEASELSDNVITSAISRAVKFITVLKARYSAPQQFYEPCELAYAIYLAYQAYADRVLNVPPGSYQEGQWTPIAEEIVRETSSKLQALRQVYEDYEKIIKSFPARRIGLRMCSSSAAQPLKFRIGQHDNLTSSW